MRRDVVSLDFLVLTLTQVMFHRAEWTLTVSVSLMELSHLFNISAGHKSLSQHILAAGVKKETSQT